MLVAFISTRSILLLLLISLTSVKSQGITQLVPFTNLRTASDSGFTLDLYSMVSGANLTFSLSGSYSPASLNSSSVKISQNLDNVASIPHKPVTDQTEENGGLQIDYSHNYLYTLGSNTLFIWNLSSNFPNFPQITTYSIATTSTVFSIYFAQFRSLGKIYSYIATIESKKVNSASYQYLFRVLDCTNITNITEIQSLEIGEVKNQITRVQFYQDSAHLWGFILGNNFIDIFRFNMTGNMSSGFVETITGNNFGLNTFAPVSLAFYGGSGYYCDATLGVYQFSISQLSEYPPSFDVTQNLYSASSLGTITSCTVNSVYLTIDTLNGTVVYSLPDLEELNLFPFPQGTVTQATYGMITNNIYTVGYVNTVVGKNTVTSFRVFSSSMSYLNSLLTDYQISAFLLGDLTNTNPAYALYQQINDDNTYIIVNAGKNILVYMIEPSSILTFQAQGSQQYTYSGEITVTNGENTIVYPFLLSGISPSSTGIYEYRGVYPGDGYSVPTTYASYVLYINGSSFYSYLPLSNYFEGANITYGFSIGAISTGDILNYTLPAKSNLLQSLTTSQSETPETYVVSLTVPGVINEIDIIAVISSQVISVFECENQVTSLIANITISPNYVTPDQVVLVEYLGNVYLAVECSGVNNQSSSNVYYELDWYFYNITGQGTYLGSQSFNNRPPSDIIQAYGTYFYSLNNGQIEIWTVNYLPKSFSINLYSVINSSTAALPNFYPVTFVVRQLIFVYDYNYGLVAFQVSSGPFTAVMFSFPIVQAYSAQMQVNADNLLILLTNFSTSYVYIAPINMFVGNYLTELVQKPLTHCAYPISISLSGTFYSVLCDNSGSVYAQIYDLNAVSYASLYTEINPNYQGYFALGTQNVRSISDVPGYGLGYFTDGTILTVYYIGQMFDSAWNNNYPVQAVPNYDLSIPTWVRVNFTFASSIYYPQYNLVFTVTASNIYSSMSQTIFYTLYNSANYISINSRFNYTASTLTYGQITIYNETVQVPLPLQVFSGNDIEFAYYTYSPYVLHSSNLSCAAGMGQQICFENKTYENAIYADNSTENVVYDFDYYDEMLLATNRFSAIIYNLANNSQVVGNYTYSSLSNFNVQCYHARFVSNGLAFVIGCTEFTSTGYVYYIIVQIPNKKNCASQTFQVNYPTLWLNVKTDANNVTWIYHYEGTTISILQLIFINTVDECTFSFQEIGQITQNTLQVNTFDAVSYTQLNSTTAVIGEKYLGLIFVNINSATISNNLVQTFSFNSIFMPYNDVLSTSAATVISLNILSDNNTALLVMDTAEVYKISINNLVVLAAYPKLLQNGQVPEFYFAGVDEKNSMLGFAVYTYENLGVLRFLNYSMNEYSAIYKDWVLTNVNPLNSQYPGRILFVGGSLCNVLHNLSPSVTEGIDRPIHSVVVRNQPMAYFYPDSNGKWANGTFSLTGFSKGYSTNQFLKSIPYNYANLNPPSPIVVDTDDIFRSNWNKWYFWVILGTFSLVLVSSVIAVYNCISKGKQRRNSSHLDIGLTSVNT